mmetsp:Transcript_12969/g.19389  ORF Transcript_12969/g.19389 Transcript_12969/m.19389 type:complete len:504 (-) Transcript_12969:76-1587(-)
MRGSRREKSALERYLEGYNEKKINSRHTQNKNDHRARRKTPATTSAERSSFQPTKLSTSGDDDYARPPSSLVHSLLTTIAEMSGQMSRTTSNTHANDDTHPLQDKEKHGVVGSIDGSGCDESTSMMDVYNPMYNKTQPQGHLEIAADEHENDNGLIDTVVSRFFSFPSNIATSPNSKKMAQQQSSLNRHKRRHTLGHYRIYYMPFLLLLIIVMSYSISNYVLQITPLPQSLSSVELTPFIQDEKAATERYQYFYSYLIEHQISTPSKLEDRKSPQHFALKWIANEDVGTTLEMHNVDPWVFIQRYILAVLYFSTNPAAVTAAASRRRTRSSLPSSWKNDCHFLSPKHECAWKDDGGGVQSCDSQHRIIDISFHNNDLKGTIPEEIGWLSELKLLNFQNNQLFGTIPKTMGSLQHLYYLGLHDNALIGTVPSDSFSDLTNLKTLHLENNDLEGIIGGDDPLCLLRVMVIAPIHGSLEHLTADCGRGLLQLKKPEISCSCCTECY